ncbi:MAG TPA: hypothetical protein VGE67_13265 [Haloferula sp.]
MTRSEMAGLIRKVATGSISDSEWQSAMVNQYEDIAIERARAWTIQIRTDRKGLPEENVRLFLDGLANGLEADVNPDNFYFNGGLAGILLGSIPDEATAEIGYEPYRSGSHLDFVTVLNRDGQASCEYMFEGKRRQFSVIDLPAYGRLLVTTSPR